MREKATISNSCHSLCAARNTNGEIAKRECNEWPYNELLVLEINFSLALHWSSGVV